jgi:hypothetical protein
VVATRSASTLEVITSGQVRACTNRMRLRGRSRFFGDGALRAQMAATAREHAERYRTATIAGDYDRVLTEALA